MRVTCILCDDQVEAQSTIRDWVQMNGRTHMIHKCYECVQDIYALEGELAEVS